MATSGSPGTTVKPVADVDKKHKDPMLGDAEAAFSDAPVTIDAEYSTPTQHHNPMELFATSCVWDDDKLTVYKPSQFVYGAKYGVAQQLGIDPEDVQVISPFVGGAFGSKGSLTQRTALTAIAARRLGRPVKLVATRKQGFTIATYRAETRHHLRLGASRDGRILAYLHEAWELTSRPDNSVTTLTAIAGSAINILAGANPHRIGGRRAGERHDDVAKCTRRHRSPQRDPQRACLVHTGTEVDVKLGEDIVTGFGGVRNPRGAAETWSCTERWAPAISPSTPPSPSHIP